MKNLSLKSLLKIIKQFGNILCGRPSTTSTTTTTTRPIIAPDEATTPEVIVTVEAPETATNSTNPVYKVATSLQALDWPTLTILIGVILVLAIVVVILCMKLRGESKFSYILIKCSATI